MSGNLYAQFVNNTGSPLSGLQISYDVEKYRNGSNPAGFRYQLFYSLDGAAWTNAGPNFFTAFPADADNSGFATAPGATVSVTNKTINVSVANGANVYLAWNYSVVSGSTTTNAQALAIDNISVLGLGNATPTNPTGIGAATPNSVLPGESSTLTVSITPGANPTSTGVVVTADLSSIGGSTASREPSAMTLLRTATSTRAIVGWIWDHRFSMVAADNLGIEAYPYTADNDVTQPGQPVPERGVDHNGGLHRPLLPLLGLAMGEMFALDELAEDCAADGVYEFFFSAKPLNVVGGVGSPANAMAIK